MKYIFTMLWLCLATPQSFAYTADTLPQGIRSPSFRFGVISGLDETYSKDGSLLNLGESRSISFNAQTLSQVSSDARVLISALNKFGSKNFGQDINLGTLKVDAKPEISYWAPVFAYGVKKNWTLAVAVPLIKYRNKVSLSSEPANLDFYRSQFSGISGELDQALNINLVEAAQSTMQTKGYRALGERDESFLADAQLVSIYQFAQADNHAWALQTQLNLPTGPKYDADDLMALNIFGRTSIDNSLIYSYKMGVWEFIPLAGLTIFLPDRVQARVPTDENDSLPDASQKQDLTRTLGASFNLSAQTNYTVNFRWSLTGALEFSNKQADRYEGSQNSRYDLLSTNTSSTAVRSRLRVTYSSVNDYFAKSALIPGLASLEISDTVFGQNTERRLQTELNLMMFF